MEKLELNLMIELKAIAEQYFNQRISLVQAIGEASSICKEDKVLEAFISHLKPTEQ